MTTRELVKKIIIAPFIGLIMVYKYLISPLLPAGCRHHPTCSVYAMDALKMHGLVKGGRMAGNRILRCNPWGTSGLDPVPKFIFKKVRPGGAFKSYPRSNRLKHS